MRSRDNHRDSFKELVGALAKLPGVGPKTAQRYAFYLLHVDRTIAQDLSDSIIDALKKSAIVLNVIPCVRVRFAKFVLTVIEIPLNYV